jgi:general secretion pathway protein M
MTAQALRTWWLQRAAREQALVVGAAGLVLLALVWGLALAPALKTLRQHDARMAQLQAGLSQMQGLESQAKQLQSQSAIGGTQAQQALQTHTTSLLGKQAELATRAGGATITLRGVSPTALGRWLATIRTEAHAKVVQSRLQRNAEGWSGSVHVTLPE